MSEPASDRRVDDLRQQLRALGYLDAGVDRFVLGPVRETRRPAAIALLASGRVGILAAVLLGPAAAIGVGGRVPGLITSPHDAIVIALYMGALFGAAVSVAAFAASLAVASIAGERIARGARSLSRIAGSIVAIACVAYLTLWWRTANAGANAAFIWSAPVWTGVALAVAVAISLLLGHAVSVTALAVIVAGRTGGAGGAPGRVTATPVSWSWKMSIVSGVLAFAGAAALLIVTAPIAARDEPVPPLTVVSSGLRVRLVAVDGFDPGVFEALARDGRIPGLTAALSSTRARLLSAQNDASRDPARAWTTIATGQQPDAHGVHGIETRRVAGVQGAVPSSGEPSRLGAAIGSVTDLLRLTRPSIASGTERREKTIWEVASDAGLRTAVVNWWATWPARADAAGGGIVLTDRATLRLERGGTLDAEIAPAALYDRLRASWPLVRAGAAGRAAARWPSPASADPDVRAVLQRSAELDAIQLTLMHEASAPEPDLTAVYLPGLDIAQHALLGSSQAGLSASAVSVRVEAIRDYYVFLDRLLTETLRPAAGEVVILVTQPGRVAAAADGLMGISGRLAAPGATAAGRASDVAPTVLHALGVPISRELPGAALTGLFTPEFTTRYPVRQVASYGRPAAKSAARGGQPLDQEMIDRLRSLGYVR